MEKPQDTVEGLAREWAELGMNVLELALGGLYHRVMVHPNSVYGYLTARYNVKLQDPSDLRKVPIDTLDMAADDFTRAAQVETAMEGAFLGSGGLTTIPVDVLTLASSAVRLTQRIALLYHFGVRTEEEKAAVFAVLGRASGLEGHDQASRVLVGTLPGLFTQSPYSRVLTYKLTRELLKQLGRRMLRGRFGRLLPILGAGFSAYSNYKFLGDVGEAAKAYYREQFLERKVRAGTEAENRARERLSGQFGAPVVQVEE